MKKSNVIFSFLSRFWLAYDEQTINQQYIEDNNITRYITYQHVSGFFGQKMSFSADLWQSGVTAWTEIDDKAEEIAAAIGRSGVYIPCEGGAAHIMCGTPFAQHMADEGEENRIRRVHLLFEIEYLTEK